MGVLSIFILVIFVVSCLLLILMVIIQDSDSDSLGGVFGGGSGSAFGSRSSNVVVKFTSVLGALFFVCAFSLALINKTSLGNVEKAAAQDTSAATTEWWNPQESGSTPQAPEEAPTPDSSASSGN